MASYISSNDNRFYVAPEAAYGQVSTSSARSRIPAVKLTTKQQLEKANRKDKTGTRTFPGDPSGLRRITTFGLSTYLTGWTDQTREPSQGPLFEACLGTPVAIWAGGSIASMPTPTRVAFTSAHGLIPGQAISVSGDIRFVSAVRDGLTVEINAPFSATPASNTPVRPTANYQPATNLPSLSIYDYWDPPATALQRILSGAAINGLRIKVNGDFHEFEFSGGAADLIDSASFTDGEGRLTQFPQEPPVAPLNYSIIPGHLGQIWLGNGASRFCTVTKANLTFHNDLDFRDREFGCPLARGVSPGARSVSLELSLYEKDTAETQALYQAARQRSPISVMIQLGQQPGQLFGIYLQSIVSEVPEFDDTERRLQWHFLNCMAQGGLNDEIFVAFG